MQEIAAVACYLFLQTNFLKIALSPRCSETVNFGGLLSLLAVWKIRVHYTKGRDGDKCGTW